jgi:hypothetical protein
MRTQRKIAATVTNRPPEKRTMRPAFLKGRSEDFHSMGMGIHMR